MQNPLVRITYCMPPVASRIKDIESKYYVALRLSVHRDLGTTIAANPSTILAIARLGDREKETPDPRPRRRHDRPPSGTSPPRSARRSGCRTRWKRKAAARRLEAIVERTGRLLPKDYWPEPLTSWPTGPAGRWGPTSGAIPSTSATARSATSA